MSRNIKKPTKWLCAQRRLRSAYLPSLARVFTVHMKKAWVLSYPLSAQRRLWSDWADALGGCPGWSESSLGAHSFCWFCHVMAHIINWQAQFFIACYHLQPEEPLTFLIRSFIISHYFTWDSRDLMHHFIHVHVVCLEQIRIWMDPL